jgi:hypothetical protein
MAVVLPVFKTRNPTAGLAMGFDKFLAESKPNRRAAQQQHVKQQVQIQTAIHNFKLTSQTQPVNPFLAT